MITACRNVNHPVSVAEVIMTILKGKKELDQFTLTRGEYANKIDKSPNAVRMMMRHGNYLGNIVLTDPNIYLSLQRDRVKAMIMTTLILSS